MRLKLQLILFCLMFLGGNCISSPTIVSVKNPGKLSKQIKDVAQIEQLQIEGTINSDDIAYFSMLPNLKILDLSNVLFDTRDVTAKENRGKYLAQSILTLPNLILLEKLYLPNNGSINGFRIEQGTLSNLLYIKMPLNSFLQSSYSFGEFTIEQLELTGTTELFGELPKLLQQRLEKEKRVEIISEKKEIASIRVKELIIPDESAINCKATQEVLPFVIYTKNNGKRILNKWDKSFDISILNQVSDIRNRAFEKIAMKVLKIPTNISEIENSAFEGANIEQIEIVKQIPPSVYLKIKNGYYWQKIEGAKLTFSGTIIIPEDCNSVFLQNNWGHLNLKEKELIQEDDF